MKIKTSELIGPALDWVVAKCEGREPGHYLGVVRATAHPDFPDSAPMFGPDLQYSTDWAQGGRLIDREKLCVGYQHQLDPAYVPLLDPATICWARTTAGGYLKYGPTLLIAAMRCFVASRLGDEVDVPDELLS